MPQVVETASKLRVYRFHGVHLEERGDHAIADCPFCGGDEKFSVDIGSGLWRCFVCGTGTADGGGNEYTFMRKLHEAAFKQTPADQYAQLADDRGLNETETLMLWGVARSPLMDAWLLPGYGLDGKLNQLYRYSFDHATKKRLVKASPGIATCLFGLPLRKRKSSTAYLCEGPWDAMAWWETLKRSKRDDRGKLAVTGNESYSLLADADVLAVPGAQTFRDEWLPAFRGVDVIVMYDSDLPKKNRKTGVEQEPIGREGAKRVSRLFASAIEPPKSVQWLQWGEQGYDPAKKSGFDVRDALCSVPDSMRLDAADDLLKLIKPIPEDWIEGRTNLSAKSGGMEITLVPCSDWHTLYNQMRKAVKLTEGLDRAFSIMLACSLSTMMPDDQLWVQIISPPSTGKTTLCDAMGVNRKYTKTVGTFTGLHSGWQTDSEGEEDHSTIATLKDKTLIIKDADPLLKSPRRAEILADLRDAYDTNCSRQWKNKVKREYINLRFTIIMCGTDSLLELDSADLGARFLVCEVMRGIDEEFETSINSRVFHRVLRNRGMSVNGTQKSHTDAEVLLAKQMTGGYVDYLRSNAAELLAAIDVDYNLDEFEQSMNAYAQFVAFMRARPSTTQEESETREMSARLNIQLTRLALCLAVVLSRKTVDAEVLRRVRQTAIDTARGRAYELCRWLKAAGDVGETTDHLAIRTGQEPAKERKMLRFMKRIGVVDAYTPKAKDGVRSSAVRWRLTPRLKRLWERVFN